MLPAGICPGIKPGVPSRLRQWPGGSGGGTVACRPGSAGRGDPRCVASIPLYSSHHVLLRHSRRARFTPRAVVWGWPACAHRVSRASRNVRTPTKLAATPSPTSHIPTHSHAHSHFYACTLAPSTLPHHPSVPNTSLQHPLFSQSHLNDMASLRRVAAAALCLLALVASASAACTTGESVSLCPFHLAQQRLVADRQLQHAWAHGLTPGLPPPPPPPSRLPPHRLAPAGPGCHQHPQRSPGQVPQQHPGRCHRHVRLLPGHPHPPGRR